MSEPTRSARGVHRRRSAWGRIACAVALTCLAASADAERFPTEGDGFTVKRESPVKWIAPSEDPRAGWMEVLKVTGTGKETAGRKGSSFDGSVTVTVGVDKCPTADGIVKGTGDYSATLNLHIKTPDGMNNRLVSVSAHVVFTGHVGENAHLTSVDAETNYRYDSRGDLGSNRGGPSLSVPSVSIPGQFQATYPVTNDHFGDLKITSLDPLQAQLEERAFLTALLASYVEPAYQEALVAWHEHDRCVTIKFDPASSTTRVAPGESIRVQAQLLSKEKSTPVGAGFEKAEPAGSGSVTPKQGRSEAASPITFTYTAPQDKEKNKGFGVEARSHAGATDGVWAPLGSGAFKFEGVSFVCEIPVPGSKEVLHTEQQIKGDSCADLESWTIRPTNVTRGPGGRGVRPDKAFQTSCEPTGGPNAEAQIRARRARPTGASGWVCTYATAADGTVTLTFFNFKSSFCQGAKEETFTVTARPTDKCGEPPPQQRPPPTVPVAPPL